MKLPENLVLLSDEQRAELKFLATHAAEEYSGGEGWKWTREFEAGLISVRTGRTLMRPALGLGPTSAGVLMCYVAALPPEVALGTLAYIEVLEAEVRRLTDSTVSNVVYTAETDRYSAELAATQQRAEAAEAQAAGLQGALEQVENFAEEHTGAQLYEVMQHALTEEIPMLCRQAYAPADAPAAGRQGAGEVQQTWDSETCCRCHQAPADYHPDDKICRGCSKPFYVYK